MGALTTISCSPPRQLSGARMARLWANEALPAGANRQLLTPQQFVAFATPRFNAPPTLVVPTGSISPLDAQTHVLSDPAFYLK